MQCLLQQQPRPESFLIYKGTLTTPPCKPVFWLLYTRPVLINPVQSSDIYDAMGLFRPSLVNARQKKTKIT